MASDELEPLPPRDALDWYLEDRQDDTRRATRRTHESALGFFVDWTDEAGIENLNELSGRDLQRFKTWRKNSADLQSVTLNGNLAVLKTFLAFCERIDAVPEGLAEDVPLPNVPDADEVNPFVPDDEAIEAIRATYRKHKYASRQHATFELIAEVGLRIGAVRAIDLGDFDPEQQIIHLRHRPGAQDGAGTPLKNGRDGERIVNLTSGLSELLGDYVAYARHDVSDDTGREPLFTTSHGRVSGATLRRDFYKLSRPCKSANDCPHGREQSACDATKSANASDCPSSFSPHPLRRWSIMHQLDEGVPREILSDRVDVSVPVLEKHYDQRTEERKSRRRREVLENHLAEYADD